MEANACLSPCCILDHHMPPFLYCKELGQPYFRFIVSIRVTHEYIILVKKIQMAQIRLESPDQYSVFSITFLFSMGNFCYQFGLCHFRPFPICLHTRICLHTKRPNLLLFFNMWNPTCKLHSETSFPSQYVSFRVSTSRFIHSFLPLPRISCDGYTA